MLPRSTHSWSALRGLDAMAGEAKAQLAALGELIGGMLCQLCAAFCYVVVYAVSVTLCSAFLHSVTLWFMLCL